MSFDKVFVFEFASIDRGKASSVRVNKITPLDHEVFNDTMECASLIPNRDTILLVLAGAKLSKVFRRFRTNITK